MRLGLLVGAEAAWIGGDAPLVVTAPDGSRLAGIPAGETWRARATPTGLELLGPAGAGVASAAPLELAPVDGRSPVRVNGRPYRGRLDLLRDRTGLTVANRLGFESYLAGVVSAEMGRRGPQEVEALRAQAVVSRTYAQRGLGRRKAQGFDLYASVADQAYGGMAAETPEGNEAVGSTRGLMLGYGGAPIDAFFYSTCGGRTAEATEVFRFAARPYLRSISDLAGNGAAYCSISPRYRWREEWSGEALRATLSRTLPPVAGIDPSQVRQVRDVRVVARTRSGRVGELTVSLAGTAIAVAGPAVRQVLRAPSGELLRSNAFTLRESGDGSRVTRLVAEGAGAGHGVGMCQWGAVGRARAGQTYQEILAAYFPGTALQRVY